MSKTGNLTINTAAKPEKDSGGDLQAADLNTAAAAGQADQDDQAAASLAEAVADKPEALAEVAEVDAAAGPSVKLVLAGSLKRYARGQSIFTSELIYTCTQGQALTMLGWEVDGVPIFKRYKAVSAAAKEQSYAPTQPREVVLSNETSAKALEIPNTPVERRIDLTTPEEEAELLAGLELDGEEDNGVNV